MATNPTKKTPDQRDFLTLTITTEADGLSNVGDLGGLAVGGLQMSTAWTAADIGFFAGRSSDNLFALYGVTAVSSSPSLTKIATTASRSIGFNGQIFYPFRFIQLASLATGSTSAVAQAAEREVQLMLLTPRGPIK